MSLYESLMENMNGHRYQDYWMAVCPFHSSTPVRNSLMVHEDGFHCMSCRKHGTLAYLARTLGDSYIPQKPTEKVLPKFRKWLDKYGTVEEIAYHAHRFLKNHREFQGYLRERKMDWAISQGKFGYLDGWITIPVIDAKNQIIDIVCRSIKEKNYVLMMPQKNMEPPLYSPNWKRVQEADEVFVPFGIFDSWALEALEKPSITGTAGKSISVNQIYKLGKQVRFVPDRGEESDAYDIANRLGWRAIVRCLKFPNGAKDLDETRRKFGNETLLSLLEA